MKPITATRMIDAPLDLVFHCISDPSTFQKAIPSITDLEFLSNERKGVGTHFRESRLIKRRIQTRTSCVIGFVVNQSVQFLSAYNSSLWISKFSVEQAARDVEVNVEVYPLLPLSQFAKIIAALTCRPAVQLLECDLDFVKSFCEAGIRREDG
jgi:hypothetical protein